MIPIPAIDLKDGKVVRLFQGNFNEETVYFDKPEIIAKRFEEEGAKRIHVVDLNGALGGEPKNFRSIEAILKKIKIPIEVGGGIRSLDLVDDYFKMGASWAILGTKACLDEGFIKEAVVEFRQKIIIGIDAKAGFVATDGWTNVTKTRAIDLALSVQNLGGKTIIYTDIAKDGVLKGPNLNEIKNICQSLTIDVIASGGIGSLQDIQSLLALKQKNLTGVIVGKALYEKKFSVGELVQACLPSA